jgi:biopolymer transport protein ExbD
MAQKLAEKDETLSEVNVIPLADLSLVLLIILMVMSPMISQALIQVSAAKAAAAQSQEDVDKPETPIIVSFAPGVLKLNGIAMGSDLEFVTHLDEMMPNRRDKSIILTASPDLMHGKVVRLMDVVKRHGAETLILVKWDATRQASDRSVSDCRVVRFARSSQ